MQGTRGRDRAAAGLVAVLAALALLLAMAPVAGADEGELELVGAGAGQAVDGSIAPVGDTGFDPTSGYPAAAPAGFADKRVPFAGIITAKGPDGSQVQTYCVDLLTGTRAGLGYRLGRWSEAEVPLVGYVARILADYHPNTDLPAAGGDVDLRAAAVQSAIWYFTEKFVLDADDPAYPAARGIVAAVLAAGPVEAAEPPSLQVVPPPGSGPEGPSGPVGTVLGPYQVTSSAPATISSAGQLYADAAGTVPLPATLPAGTTDVYVQAGSAGEIEVAAAATATVPSGNVYLYDGETYGVPAAQKLILAKSASVATRAKATASYYDTGSLLVTKSLAGAGAQQRGEVVLEVSCTDGTEESFVVPAGEQPRSGGYLIDDLPAGTLCTVTEPSSGGNAAVTVTVAGLPQQPVLIAAGGQAAVDVTNSYAQNAGALRVTKTISGAAAGRGSIALQVTCDEGTARTFTIPAGQQPDEAGYLVPDLPAGTVCTITETADGATATAAVTVSGSGQQVTIPAGAEAAAEVTNAYTVPKTPRSGPGGGPTPTPTPVPVTPVSGPGAPTGGVPTAPGPGGLPASGADGPGTVLGAGLLLALAGTALLLGSRRPRRTH
jgi:hypothetical protein